MHLHSIRLFQFKNYFETEVTFSKGANVLVGPNGGGKSNLIDAIHVMSFTRSAFGIADSDLTQHGHDSFRVQARFLRQGLAHDVECYFEIGEGKTFKEGTHEVIKLRDYIGRFPAVVISPYDQELIWNGSEQRRRFFDSVLSQVDPGYIHALSKYSHLHRQRNLMLQALHEPDRELVDTYNEQMLPLADRVYHSRKTMMKEFVPLLSEYFDRLGEPDEKVHILYRSDLDDGPWIDALNASYQRDRRTGRTSTGVHRDDYKFRLGSHDLRNCASQGQQKSFLLALKLAQFDIISRSKGFPPIMLMDDVFDRLDDQRISRVIRLTATPGIGQVFLTDARPERTRALLKSVGRESACYTIEGGKVKHEN